MDHNRCDPYRSGWNPSKRNKRQNKNPYSQKMRREVHKTQIHTNKSHAKPKKLRETQNSNHQNEKDPVLRRVKMSGSMSYEVAAEDDFGSLSLQVLDGRHSGTDSGVIGDVEVVIQRHV
jgi:hypothetical protein